MSVGRSDAIALTSPRTNVHESAKYAMFELEGIADGVMGPSFAGRIQCPYFVMVETKRGVENTNPIFQLYGQLLAAAWLNDQLKEQDVQEIFGCFTIAHKCP